MKLIRPVHLPLKRFSEDSLPELLVHLDAYAVPSLSSTETTQSELAAISPVPVPCKAAFFDHISKTEAFTIYSIVRTIQATSTLEIGFCCGASALSFLKAHSDQGTGMHFAVDPYQRTYARGQGIFNVTHCGLSKHFRLFESSIESVYREIPRVQCALIDSSHLFDLSIIDFVFVDKLLEVGGLLLIHDSWMPSIQKLVRYILMNRDYELLSLNYRRSRIASLLRAWSALTLRIPMLEKLFSQEITFPWRCFESDNLILLRKTGEDMRPWVYHSIF